MSRSNLMKAVVYTRYGSPDVLELSDVEKPSPRSDQVLVKVHATGVNAGDWHLLRGKPFPMRLMGFGLLKPKHQILGTDVAGVVEAVGESVMSFKPGDEVFGDLSASGFGGYAEYVCAREDALALKPQSLSFEEAAAVPTSAFTALQALRDKGKVQPGQEVLINGASGGIGSYAVQIAKALGARVTGVCSTKNLDMVRALGADEVIDYTKVDFTMSEKHYDVIHAANGYHPLSHYKRALKPGGIYVMSGGSSRQLSDVIFLGPFMSMFGGKKMCNLMMKPRQSDLHYIAELIESGKVKPVIETCYPLAQVAEAIRRTEEGHNSGKVVIRI